MGQTRVDLTGVPETMLWTVYNRAGEARRPGGFLRDPDAVRICDSIAYDYAKSFGKPDGSHAMRSRMFDDAVKPWMAAHPGGAVVELGAGLETQYLRCDDGRVRWVCVDVAEAIDVRELFLASGERCKHVRKSALDLSWMDEVDGSKGLFVTAQGLLMYFTEAEVRRLLVAIIDRFPGVEIMFDTIPRWFSQATLKGWGKTKSYKAPPMPWGINRTEIEPTLRTWSARVVRVELASYGYIRGIAGVVLPLFARLPILNGMIPSAVRLHTAAEPMEAGRSAKPVPEATRA